MTEEWTGYQVAWKMARGYSGAFGHALNSPFVFVPLCLIFLLGLFDWRRWRRVANLDLLFLLGFTVSHFFFNRAEIGVSVPLQYPPLVYLLARALWIGFRGRGEGLRPVWPTAWLVIAVLFLMGVRVGLNVANAGAIDVGYAGVVGADKIVHGEPIYDNFPEDIHSGDTYGPVNYLAYVPFELIWPYSGEWDDLPAAHAAGVIFDLAVLGFLVLLGLRARPGPAGQRLAAILAFGWAAYPYTAYVLESNSNDSLLAALLVATLLVLARPFARGVMLSLATFAKFVPAVLGPMLLTYRAPGETRRLPRTALLFAAGFALVGVAAMLWPAIDPGLRTIFDRSLGAQTGRSSPFSIWGQANIEWLHTLLLAAVAALAVALAFVPRRKSLLQVAALERGAGDRGPAHPPPLVLPLHRLVLPAAAGGAGAAGARAEARTREGERGAQSCGGAGTITCSKRSASPRSLTSTTAPITQTSSVAVSKRVGICGDQLPQHLLGFDPEDAGPRAGHADVGDEARCRRGGRGRRRWGRGCGCRRRRRRGRRGASPSPPSRSRLRRGSRRSTTSASSRSRIASTVSKGERATVRPMPPREVDHRDPHARRPRPRCGRGRGCRSGSWPAAPAARSGR